VAQRVSSTGDAGRLAGLLLVEVAEVVTANATELPVVGLEVACSTGGACREPTPQRARAFWAQLATGLVYEITADGASELGLQPSRPPTETGDSFVYEGLT
jgi:hypothetical protein